MTDFDVSPSFKVGDIVLVCCGEYKEAHGTIIARFNSQNGMLYQVSLHDFGVEVFPSDWLKVLIRKKAS